MKLVRTGDQLAGSYLYQKVGKRIDLRGNIDQNGNLTLEEFDPSGKQTGVFKGIWRSSTSDGLATLAGNWSNRPVKGRRQDDGLIRPRRADLIHGRNRVVSKQAKRATRS